MSFILICLGCSSVLGEVRGWKREEEREEGRGDASTFDALSIMFYSNRRLSITKGIPIVAKERKEDILSSLQRKPSLHCIK